MERFTQLTAPACPIDIANLKLDNATGYPEPFRRTVEGRWR